MEVINPTLEVPKEKQDKNNYRNLPEDTQAILAAKTNEELISRFTKDEPVAIPLENNQGSSYLNLVLSPNLRDLELMIRGLEYVKRYNPIMGKEEVILRKIANHPLNEFGINKIMEFLKIYTSPELKLGRKRIRDYYNSVQQVGHDIVRLVYKNLKNFGMDSQVKQRNAKTFCLAIIEVADATFSRSIEGKENDLSRATEFKIESNIDGLDNPAKFFNREKKEGLKN